MPATPMTSRADKRAPDCVSAALGTESPSGQRSPDGPEDGARDVIARLTARPDRDAATGRFVKGNQAAGRTLARSGALWDALADAKRELVGQLRSDLAIDNGDAAATLAGLLDAYAEARLLRHSMFVRMVELGGPVTTKGKARALFGTYLQALDRERRLALDLGLERRAAKVPSLAEYLDQREGGESGEAGP